MQRGCQTWIVTHCASDLRDRRLLLPPHWLHHKSLRCKSAALCFKSPHPPVLERQFAQLSLQVVGGNPRIEQGGHQHVAGHPGEGVDEQNFAQSNSLVDAVSQHRRAKTVVDVHHPHPRRTGIEHG